MARDHRKILAFQKADKLVERVYSEIDFPADERFGLKSQIRRSAVSVPVNIVEGCQRKTRKDISNFLSIAMGSAAEVAYLLDLCSRIGVGRKETVEDLSTEYDEVVKMLNGLITRVGE